MFKNKNKVSLRKHYESKTINKTAAYPYKKVPTRFQDFLLRCSQGFIVSLCSKLFILIISSVPWVSDILKHWIH